MGQQLCGVEEKCKGAKWPRSSQICYLGHLWVVHLFTSWQHRSMKRNQIGTALPSKSDHPVQGNKQSWWYFCIVWVILVIVSSIFSYNLVYLAMWLNIWISGWQQPVVFRLVGSEATLVPLMAAQCLLSLPYLYWNCKFKKLFL